VPSAWRCIGVVIDDLVNDGGGLESPSFAPSVEGVQRTPLPEDDGLLGVVLKGASHDDA
jgi:hypothetical protein